MVSVEKRRASSPDTEGSSWGCVLFVPGRVSGTTGSVLIPSRRRRVLRAYIAARSGLTIHGVLPTVPVTLLRVSGQLEETTVMDMTD